MPTDEAVPGLAGAAAWIFAAAHRYRPFTSS